MADSSDWNRINCEPGKRDLVLGQTEIGLVS